MVPFLFLKLHFHSPYSSLYLYVSLCLFSLCKYLSICSSLYVNICLYLLVSLCIWLSFCLSLSPFSVCFSVFSLFVSPHFMSLSVCLSLYPPSLCSFSHSLFLPALILFFNFSSSNLMPFIDKLYVVQKKWGLRQFGEKNNSLSFVEKTLHQNHLENAVVCIL